MKIGFITTLDTNIGDDLIRKGIVELLRGNDYKGKFLFINKHKPETIFSSLHPIRSFEFLRKSPLTSRFKVKTDQLSKKYLGQTKFDNCDVIIQSGAPVLWPDCHHNEWKELIWDYAIPRLNGKSKVLNLAGGSCYPIENMPHKIVNDKEISYLRKIYGFKGIKTVRDKMALDLLEGIGCADINLLPCTAFLSLESRKNPLNNGYIFINYMEGGGHFDWGQRIHKRRWEETTKEVIADLSKDFKLAFLCHNENEVKLATNMNSDLEVFFPKTIEEYQSLSSLAIGGLFNRMHASVAFASMGIPSIAVGTDSRLLMVKELGLPTMFVKEATSGEIISIIREQIENRIKEFNRLTELKSKTRIAYRDLLSSALV